MPVPQLPGGDPFGAHRVLEPKGVLPQPSQKLDNNMGRIWDNEILVDVDTLNVDSASSPRSRSRRAAMSRGSPRSY